VKSWGELLIDFQARYDASQLTKVAMHWRLHRNTGLCPQSLLPRAFCGGCFREEHRCSVSPQGNPCLNDPCLRAADGTECFPCDYGDIDTSTEVQP